jgi:hypothetical protein
MKHRGLFRRQSMGIGMGTGAGYVLRRHTSNRSMREVYHVIGRLAGPTSCDIFGGVVVIGCERDARLKSIGKC